MAKPVPSSSRVRQIAEGSVAMDGGALRQLDAQAAALGGWMGEVAALAQRVNSLEHKLEDGRTRSVRKSKGRTAA